MIYNENEFINKLSEWGDGLPEEFFTSEIAKKLYIITRELDENAKRFNLTAIKEPEEVLKKHIIDSLFAAFYIDKLAVGDSYKIIDVGCGAGFPSLPISAALPGALVTALDSTEKKVNYVANTAALMGVDTFTAITARAEEAARNAELREQFDFSVARAVANLSVLMELCTPFIRVGGYFVAMKGAAAAAEAEEARGAAHKLGMELINTAEYSISNLPDKRFLLIYKKKSATSDLYPRNYSQISKKPL